MTDMIVSLASLPSRQITSKEYHLGLANSWDAEKILTWVRSEFSDLWSSECLIALSRESAGLLIVRQGSSPVGFCCYNATFPGFFGPTGVIAEHRGKGLGKLLLIEALHRLREQGHGYAFIGDPGPGEFYQKAVGAQWLPSSLRSPYLPPLNLDI